FGQAVRCVRLQYLTAVLCMLDPSTGHCMYSTSRQECQNGSFRRPGKYTRHPPYTKIWFFSVATTAESMPWTVILERSCGTQRARQKFGLRPSFAMEPCSSEVRTEKSTQLMPGRVLQSGHSSWPEKSTQPSMLRNINSTLAAAMARSIVSKPLPEKFSGVRRQTAVSTPP